MLKIKLEGSQEMIKKTGKIISLQDKVNYYAHESCIYNVAKTI